MTDTQRLAQLEQAVQHLQHRLLELSDLLDDMKRDRIHSMRVLGGAINMLAKGKTPDEIRIT